MTEPIDPNTGWWTPPPPSYQPPLPGYQPPPGYQPAPPWLTTPEAAVLPPPPPRRRRAPLIVGVLVAIVAAAGVLVFVAVHGSDSGSGSGSPQLSLPDSFDGYTRVAGQQGEQFESSMRSFAVSIAAGSGGPIDQATIRGYTHRLGETPVLLVFVYPTPAMPSSAPAATGGLGASLRAIAGPSMRDYPPGPHGGEVLCGNFHVGAMHEPMCAWTDSSVTGVMVSIEPITPSRLAHVEVDLRDKVH